MMRVVVVGGGGDGGGGGGSMELDICLEWLNCVG